MTETNDDFKANEVKTELLRGILKVESPTKPEQVSDNQQHIESKDGENSESLTDEAELPKTEGEHFQELPPEDSSKCTPSRDDYTQRLSALEESEELRAIYSHPSWQEFAGVLYNGKYAAATTATAFEFDQQMRQWAGSHPQIAPVIAWFHQCVARFGLSFDPYVYVPQCRQAGCVPSEGSAACTTHDSSDSSIDSTNSAVCLQYAPAEECGPYDDVCMIPTADACTSDAQQQLHWQYMQQQQQQAYIQQQQQAYNAYYFYQQHGHEQYPQQYAQQYYQQDEPYYESHY